MNNKLFITLITIFAFACCASRNGANASSPAEDEQRKSQYEKMFGAEKSDGSLQVETPESREAAATEDLKFAATLGETCTATTFYKKIADEFPETKSAAFARKAYTKGKIRELKKASQPWKNLHRLDAEELSGIINIMETMPEHCKIDGLAEAIAKPLAQVKAMRLEKYGY